MALMITTRINKLNVALCLGLAALAAGVTAYEGYLGRVDLPFAIFGGVVLLGALFASLLLLSTRRWLFLTLIAGSMGLLTQYVGVSINAWRYTRGDGSPGPYLFVFFAFALGSLCIFTLTTLLVSYVLPRRLHHRVAGVCFVVLVAVAYVLMGTGYLKNPVFLAYYAILVLFGVLFGSVAHTQTMVAVALSSCAFGLCAEALGSHAKLWTFSTPLPPFWLIAVSWPLEGIFHFGLSSVFARERPDPPLLRSTERRLFSLLPEHPMAVRPENSRVVIRRGGDDKLALLDQVIDATDFFGVLEARWRESKKPRDEFLIAVKPNFMFMYSLADHSTFTDPELVERLIDRIVERGFTRVVVVEAQSAYGNDFEGRDVVSVGRYVGYKEKNYKLVDLTLEQEPHQYPSPLGAHVVGKTWRDADFRVSFAKNKTHTWALYTLTIKNTYGALPVQNKLLAYHNRREIYAPTIAALVDFPIHFGFIDAFFSADGPFGIFADRHPNPTRTILGGQSAVAVDWVGASLMGVDPMRSRYMQLAVQAFGRPEPVVDGDRTPYSPWVNVNDALMNTVDAAEEAYDFTNIVFNLMNRMDAVFPRRKHGLLWRISRSALLPIRSKVLKEALDRVGKPDPRLD